MALPTEGFQKGRQWHAVDVELIERPLGGRVVGDLILDEAQRFGCELLVMGAYEQASVKSSRSGGSTSPIVSEANVPAFMAHWDGRVTRHRIVGCTLPIARGLHIIGWQMKTISAWNALGNR
jgi:hypothetical protein